MTPQTVQIVYIGTGSQATYSPTPPLIKPGDPVNFILHGRTDTVTVSFDSGSPFSQNNFGLDGSSTLTAQQMKTVVAGASGQYRFSATPTGTKTDPDPPGTVAGELEVISDSSGPKDPSAGGR
jgi:hypothetical protein